MTPTGFMIQHREIVLALATNNTLAEAWRLLVQRIGIDSGISKNSFGGLVKPFIETCKHDDELNKKLHEQVKELNEKLHNQQELNEKLYNDERLNEKLHENQELNEKLQISGWTIGKSGKSGEYYRAFRKVSGKVHAVHLGRHLDLIDARIKIDFKSEQIFSGRHTNTNLDT
jgi:TolA-binding protein